MWVKVKQFLHLLPKKWQLALVKTCPEQTSWVQVTLTAIRGRWATRKVWALAKASPVRVSGVRGLASAMAQAAWVI